MTCKYCGRECPRNGYLLDTRRNESGVYCKSQVACFNSLLRQRDALRRIGRLMGNMTVHLSKSEMVNSDDARVFREMSDEWEKARRVR